MWAGPNGGSPPKVSEGLICRESSVLNRIRPIFPGGEAAKEAQGPRGRVAQQASEGTFFVTNRRG